MTEKGNSVAHVGVFGGYLGSVLLMFADAGGETLRSDKHDTATLRGGVDRDKPL